MKNRKGFTLAELLIVVAIIGVLAAIAIPTFSAQLTKANQAVDIANARACYAEAVSEAMTTEKSVTKTFVAKEAYDGETTIGDITKDDISWAKNDTVSVTADATGEVSEIKGSGGTK